VLILKSIRKKNAPNSVKWEAETVNGDYVVIRYKNCYLDVRVARTYEDFLLHGFTTIYREETYLSEEQLELNYLLRYLGITLED
jgi:hypothetical protein